MKTLKDRILKVVKNAGFTYSELCVELNISESELDTAIEDKNIYLLEKISKVLRIPLYSFYHDTNAKNKPGQRYYDQDIWKDDD